MDTDVPIATDPASDVPAVGALHHVGLTVTNVARSVAWYQEVLGMRFLMEGCRHSGSRATVLWRPGTEVEIGLGGHDANEGELFTCHRTGLDHVSMSVPTHGDLDAWHTWLTGHGVPCSGIRDAARPVPSALISFTDPDGIALELIYTHSPVR